MKNRNVAKGSLQPKPGELWEFPTGGRGLVGWVVVARRAGADALEELRVVPADSEEFVGPGDMAVPVMRASSPDGVRERVVLRGAYGRWLGPDDFWFQAPGAQIAGTWLGAFLGLDPRDDEGLEGPPSAFDDWVTEVLKPAFDDLEAWAARQRPSVDLVETQDSDSGVAGLSLAAAGSEILASLVSGDDQPREAFCERELKGVQGIGDFSRVFLQQYADRASLEFRGPRQGVSAPPVVFILQGRGGRHFLSFVPRLGGGWRSSLFALDGLRLRLVVGGRPIIELDLSLPTL